jgi:glutaredoxin 2
MAMDQALIVGALVLSGGSVIAIIKFWMDMGKAQAENAAAAKAAEDKAAAAVTASFQANARYEAISREINEFKVEVAQTYATSKALGEAEASLAGAMNRTAQGIYTRLDQVTQRLDQLIQMGAPAKRTR